jgi:threonine dehydrogenase-like Zn-dependent dehydrogenase
MSEMVRAAVQTGPRQIELREFPRPATGADDGLLRVEANGICGSDVETYRGHLGGSRPAFIPGHEPLGIIEEVGDRAAQRWGVQPGDRVALEVIVPCRACPDCLTGRYQFCPHRKYGHGVTGIDTDPALWGGLADVMYLSPTSVLHKVDKSLPVELAAMYNSLGAGVRWACHLGEVKIGDTVLVLGAGQRGIAAVVAARAVGAGTIIITGLAADTGEDTVERVTEITGGRMADVTLELTPMAAGPVADALAATRRGGRVILAGLKGNREIPLRTDVIINRALTVRGAFGVDAKGMDDAIALLESRRFPLEKMHTHTFRLDDAALAIQTLGGEIHGESAIHVSVHPNT